jgi:hypothetical protein
MVNSKNSLNLKKDKNTFKKSISSGRQVDGIIKKQKLNYVELPIIEKQKEILKSEAVNETKIIENQNEINNASIDDTKRMFLKVASVAGLGLAASALFPKSADAYVSGSTPTSNVVGLKDSGNTRIDPATEGGNLADIKTNTDVFTTSGAGAYVRQDSTATIAKETGGNLADIKTNTDNLADIKTATDKFKFDGDNLLISGGAGSGGYEIVGLKNISSTAINPATDEAIVYLRRMVKLMESQATTDAGNRQRITLDALGAIGATMPVSGTVTVSTISTVTSVTNMTSLAGQNQQMYQDVARNAFANGIRQNLLFT